MKALAQGDELSKSLRGVSDQLEELRKKIVGTKEGGAITGEERLREHTDELYSAILSWEGRPAKYQLERIDVLRRELNDVKGEFNNFVAQKVRPVNDELRKRKLEPIPTTPTSVSALGSQSSDTAAAH